MTNLKDINFGLNQYCGPAVLSALTGENTDRCAAVISAVSGKKEIKAVERHHLKEALKRLRFDIEVTNFGGSTLYGTLHRMHTYDGLYVVFVPKHVVAIEVINTEIYIIDNHSKSPLDIRQSARLMQKVEAVWKVFAQDPPKFVRSEVKVTESFGKIEITKYNIYENKDDNTTEFKGIFSFSSNMELKQIIEGIRRICDEN